MFIYIYIYIHPPHQLRPWVSPPPMSGPGVPSSKRSTALAYWPRSRQEPKEIRPSSNSYSTWVSQEICEISGNIRKSREISMNINEYQWISDEEGKCQPFWLKPRDGLGRRSRAFFRPHKHLGCFESWKKSHARCSARSFIHFAMDWKVGLSVEIPSGYLT